MYIKDIFLTMSPNYVKDWSVPDAVKEFIQNSLDTDNYELYVTDGELHITSYGETIDEKHLLLGSGTKSEDESKRGGFCEGFKIAMLILAREGINCEMLNGSVIWKPTIKFNSDFNMDCLAVEVHEAEEYFEGVKVTITLDDYTIQDVISRTLAMQDDYEKVETSYGEVLLDKENSGKIFVGGLFVQNFPVEHGYNFPPEDFKLDRDRRALSPFDIEWQCRKLWEEAAVDADEDLAEEIIEAVIKKDRSFNSYGSVIDPEVSDNVINLAEDLYKEKYNGKLVSSDWQEVEQLREAGNENVTYVDNRALVSFITKTDSYQTVVMGKKEKVEIDLEEMVERFYDTHYYNMSSEMEEDWNELKQAILDSL